MTIFRCVLLQNWESVAKAFGALFMSSIANNERGNLCSVKGRNTEQIKIIKKYSFLFFSQQFQFENWKKKLLLFAHTALLSPDTNPFLPRHDPICVPSVSRIIGVFCLFLFFFYFLKRVLRTALELVLFLNLPTLFMCVSLLWRNITYSI